MNQKTCKQIRKAVRLHLDHMEARALVCPRGSNVKLVPAPGLRLDGTTEMVPFVYTGTLFNAPGTQRAVYRRAKAHTRAG